MPRPRVSCPARPMCLRRDPARCAAATSRCAAIAAGIDGEAFRVVERNCWFLLYRLRSRRCHSAGRFYFGSCCIARLRLLGGDGAPSRKAAPRDAAGQLRELSFVLKGRFCAGWTNQAIEIIASWHISRAHHLAASAGRLADISPEPSRYDPVTVRQRATLLPTQ